MAMAHAELQNWGFVIKNCREALALNPGNVKAHYRLAKAHETRREYEACESACEEGLKLEPSNAPLKKMLSSAAKRAEQVRVARQKKERARVQRLGQVKSLYKWCKQKGVKLGRVPLVSSLEDEDDVDDTSEKRWNHLQPNTGKVCAASEARRRRASALHCTTLRCTVLF